MTKVYGPDSALQIPLAPNSQSQPIFDYNGRQFYVVTTDGAGSKTLETFDYQPHVEQPKPTTGPAYVTREEFEKAIQRIEGKIDGIHGPVQSAADVL